MPCPSRATSSSLGRLLCRAPTRPSASTSQRVPSQTQRPSLLRKRANGSWLEASVGEKIGVGQRFEKRDEVCLVAVRQTQRLDQRVGGRVSATAARVLIGDILQSGQGSVV